MLHSVTWFVIVLGHAVVTVEEPAVTTVQYLEIWLAVRVSHALLVTVVVVAGVREQSERISLAVEVQVSDDLNMVSCHGLCRVNKHQLAHLPFVAVTISQ